MSTSFAQENLYLQRINAVISHVREHLHDELTLESLARVAGFSPFHFHRVFKSITEETVSDMVVRLRLERAAVLLRASPELSITDAAFESGFQSGSVFSRAFKKQFGLNARQWDRQSPLKNSKNGQVMDRFPRYTFLFSVQKHGSEKGRMSGKRQAQRLLWLKPYRLYTEGHEQRTQAA